MALLDTLTELSGKSPASKSRVDILLDKLILEAPEDYKTLQQALRDPSLPHHVITKSLRREYGNAVVTDSSVGEWRRKNLPTSVNGL